MCWIDLANAYGTEKHSLFQFSMEWCHVPDHFCEIIFNYYEGLFASVLVKDKLTPWLRFMVGVFQGCTASTILSNVAFNTCFQHLAPLRKSCKYQFSKAKVPKSLTLGYADGLSLASGVTPHGTANSNDQRAVDALGVWTKWTWRMKATPTKCVSMAIPPGPDGMQPSDPELTIQVDGDVYKMGLISHRDDLWLKFLGRFLLETLTKAKAKEDLFNLFARLVRRSVRRHCLAATRCGSETSM